MNAKYFATTALTIFFATSGLVSGLAHAEIVSFTAYTDSGYAGTSSTGQLNFDWDSTTSEFVSGVFQRSAGDSLSGIYSDYTSGSYTLDAADQTWYQTVSAPVEGENQIWFQNMSAPTDRQVYLNASPASNGTLASALASISSFSVGQIVSYEVNIVSASGGLNETWGTPGAVIVSGATANPEPSAFALLGMGAIGLIGCHRRKRKQAA